MTGRTRLWWGVLPLPLAGAAAACAAAAKAAVVGGGGDLLSTANICAIASLAIATVGVFLVIRQLRQQYAALRAANDQARYTTLFEMNKYIVDNPHMMRLYVGGRRYGHIAEFDNEALRQLARMDLMLDHIEFQYISARITSSVHAVSLLRAQFSNPELMAFWRSPLRGHFDADFEARVEKIVAANEKAR